MRVVVRCARSYNAMSINICSANKESRVRQSIVKKSQDGGQHEMFMRVRVCCCYVMNASRQEYR